MRKIKRRIWAAVFCCLLLAVTGCRSKSGLYVEQGASSEAEEASEQAEDGTVGSEEAADMIYVQVSGAVVSPGVYMLPAGSRVFEAVELAGGMTQEADVNALNQALVLSDGQMVYVFAVGEQRSGQETGNGQGAAQEPEDGRINLNTATVEELMTLPGIGQSKAESIVSWREENGAFGSVEDIMNITGIKEGVFSRIKDHIKVN